MSQESMTHQVRTPIGTNNPFAATMIASPVPVWRRRGVIIGAIVVLLLIIIGAVLLPLLLRKPAVAYQYQQVTTGNISSTISATGPLQSAIYNLIFTGTGGRIASINVKVGQNVVKGQVLASLDKTSLQDAYNQQQSVVQAAQNALKSAQTNLANQQSLGGANASSAQTTLANDQAALGNTQAQQQALIAQDQQTLSNDQNALNNTQATSQASVNAAQTTLNNDQTALRNAQSVANAQIAADQATRDQAINTCNISASATAGPNPPANPTPTTTYTDCVNAANATFAQQKATAEQSVATAQAAVNAAQSALNTAQATANANNDAAQAKVNADQSALDTAQATANTNIQAAQAKVAADQKAINTTGASSTLSNSTSQAALTADEGTLQNAQVLLQADQHNLDNGTLTAPHDGTVSVINGSVGGSPGTPATASSGTTSATSGSTFIQLVDPSTLQVVANVNETDTGNIKPGDPVQFTVNAYGNQQFSGTVDSISPNGQSTSNVVTYPVYINIDSNSLKGAKLLSGMTANATITTVQHLNVLLIPVNAVNFARLASSGSTTATVPQAITPQQAATALTQAREMMNSLAGQQEILSGTATPAYVLENVNGHITAKPVVLGMNDGTQYEVLDGLTTNDTIIVGVSSSSSGRRTAPASGGAGGGATGG
ncbi:MAG: HlyD family efflux transporter periplasmic adaptor subunit [Chloroflexota bacterium]|nr:HlyD family efflux transporter periplasmic adaptor subunit [Chloroflexota bacterium]